jgi:hypothetical protein
MLFTSFVDNHMVNNSSRPVNRADPAGKTADEAGQVVFSMFLMA